MVSSNSDSEVTKVFILFAIFCAVGSVNSIYVIDTNTTRAKVKPKAESAVPTPATEWTEVGEDGMWAAILEDWTLSQTRTREGRVLQPTHKYIPTNGFYISKRIGEAEIMEFEPHKRMPPQNNGPPINIPQHHQQPPRQNYNNMAPSPREVSETDLYLLGAIEKLVYRVDYMEKRLRRTEQLLYYVMAGNNQKEENPCPGNFTYVGKNCYHFGTERSVNWKSASALCKSLGAHLAEFETIAENKDVVKFLLNNNSQFKGKDFWLGGLNPGLLWIWANSAKPVNPNANLTSISMQTPGNENNDNVSKISQNKIDTAPITDVPTKPKNPLEITGNGRCLRLSFMADHGYVYTGEECSMRFNYMCEYIDRTLDNEISRIAKDLKYDD